MITELSCWSVQALSEIIKCSDTLEKLMRSSDEDIITPKLKRPPVTTNSSQVGV